MPGVSIALATYNGARHLEEQLASLANQSLLPVELIVADDGSTDSSLSIARRFAVSAPFPVKILESSGRLGYRLNFRRAAQACTGDLIAFCDQDDRWYPHKLERMVPCFADPEVLLAYHNAIVFDEAATRPLHFAATEAAAVGKPFRYVNGLLQIFRADLLRFDALWDKSIDHNEGNVILAHDQWFFILATILGKVVFVDEPLLEYRQHGANTYGVEVGETRLNRFFAKFLHYGDQDLWAARSADSLAAICDEIAASERRPDLQATALAYGALAARLRRRAAVYSEASLPRRTKAMFSLIQDYKKEPWAFAKRSAVRDLWKGVLLGSQHDPTRS